MLILILYRLPAGMKEKKKNEKEKCPFFFFFFTPLESRYYMGNLDSSSLDV